MPVRAPHPDSAPAPLPGWRNGAGAWCSVVAPSAPPPAGEGWGGRGPFSGLADLETGEPLHGQAGLVDDLLHRALGLGDRRLLEQDEVLVVGVDPALDDPADRLLGLALLLGGLLGDAALGLDRLGRDLVAGEEARAGRGDVHRQAARGLLAAAAVLD